MISNQPRKPAGLLADGHWAAMPLSGVELPASEIAGAFLADYGEDLEAEVGRCSACDGYSRTGQGACRSCRGSGRIPTARDWAAVGVTDLEALAALRDGEYRPEDLVSADPNMRLGAHIAAGTMVLDGRLTNNAFILYRHDGRIGRQRNYHPRSHVTVNNKKVRWSSLSATEQCEHIAGYAAGVCAGNIQSDASALFKAGYRDGMVSEATAILISHGTTSEAIVVTRSGHLSHATGIEPMDDECLSYTGFIAASRSMPYEQKAMIARDAIVGPLLRRG